MDLDVCALADGAVCAFADASSGHAGDTAALHATPIDATLVPDEGYAFIDTVPGVGQILTHCGTLECQRLPTTAQHSIIFDEEGFGMLVSEAPEAASQTMVPLDEHLKYLMYDVGERDFVIVRRGGDHKKSFARVGAMLSKYSEFSFKLPMGPRQEESSFMCAHFKWPRQGAVMYISLKCVYKRLGFSQFGGESWRWIDAGLSRWCRFLEEQSLHGHVQWSCQVVQGSSRPPFSGTQTVLHLCMSSLAAPPNPSPSDAARRPSHYRPLDIRLRSRTTARVS